MALCLGVKRHSTSEDQREEKENADAAKVRSTSSDVGDKDIAYEDGQD